MPAYNFKRRFVDLIRSGEKHTTIRPARKHKTRAGDVLHLFTGMRTKNCEKIGTFRCVSVVDVIIWTFPFDVWTNAKSLSKEEIEQLARTDGFESASEFFQFFLDVYGSGPHRMQLITWEGFNQDA